MHTIVIWLFLIAPRVLGLDKGSRYLNVVIIVHCITRYCYKFYACLHKDKDSFLQLYFVMFDIGYILKESVFVLIGTYQIKRDNLHELKT